MFKDSMSARLKDETGNVAVRRRSHLKGAAILEGNYVRWRITSTGERMSIAGTTGTEGYYSRWKSLMKRLMYSFSRTTYLERNSSAGSKVSQDYQKPNMAISRVQSE